MTAESTIDKVYQLVETHGVLRPRDLDPHQIPREYLRRLHARGLVERIGRGLYTLHDGEITEHHSLVQACKRVPTAVVCLVSALRFHGLTTQAPDSVWLALGPRAWQPRLEWPRLRCVRFSGKALVEGVERYTLEGVNVQVYNPAKTVADCFKYRHKIGQDVALEALRDCWQGKKATIDDLWRFAQICRMTNVMRPYIESIL